MAQRPHAYCERPISPVDLGANVEIVPVMNPDDLGRGLAHIAEIVREFK